MKLAWSLPALDRLDEAQLERVWRLAGGHPRSLEYLDALLSVGQARYPDATARLHAAITARLGGADRDQWLAARAGLDAALAETVALAADDVLLKDLLTRLDQVPGAADLLLGVSVYREPVDHNAVLFQTGLPDPGARHIPDRKATYQQVVGILAAAGISAGESFGLSSVPSHVRAELAPHLAELPRLPAPPFRPPSGLPGQITACQTASLLTVGEAGDGRTRFFVHRWTATELAGRVVRESGSRLARAHQQAAAYWQWRLRVWPQDRAANVHDLLEARHHLLQAGDAQGAEQVTGQAVLHLDDWGAWEQEASLIHDTLAQLPADSPRQAAWNHQLGILAFRRGDYVEATRYHQRSLDAFERLGDQAGMAAGYALLGNLAQVRGDYAEAARQYRRSLDIKEPLGDQAGMASGYGQLGVIAQLTGDYDQAARQHQRSLKIDEGLGNLAGMATTYHNLGLLAQDRGDYAEAARQYRRSLDIKERLGDQAGMAATRSQLGILEKQRGGPGACRHSYHMAYERSGDQAPPRRPAGCHRSASTRRLPPRAWHRAVHRPAHPHCRGSEPGRGDPSPARRTGREQRQDG